MSLATAPTSPLPLPFSLPSTSDSVFWVHPSAVRPFGCPLCLVWFRFPSLVTPLKDRGTHVFSRMFAPLHLAIMLLNWSFVFFFMAFVCYVTGDYAGTSTYCTALCCVRQRLKTTQYQKYSSGAKRKSKKKKKKKETLSLWLSYFQWLLSPGNTHSFLWRCIDSVLDAFRLKKSVSGRVCMPWKSLVIPFFFFLIFICQDTSCFLLSAGKAVLIHQSAPSVPRQLTVNVISKCVCSAWAQKAKHGEQTFFFFPSPLTYLETTYTVYFPR